jgi:hypothetical protein
MRSVLSFILVLGLIAQPLAGLTSQRCDLLPAGGSGVRQVPCCCQSDDGASNAGDGDAAAVCRCCDPQPEQPNPNPPSTDLKPRVELWLTVLPVVVARLAALPPQERAAGAAAPLAWRACHSIQSLLCVFVM